MTRRLTGEEAIRALAGDDDLWALLVREVEADDATREELLRVLSELFGPELR